MAPVHVLDDFYLSITLLFSLGYQMTAFLIAWSFQTDKLTDLSGGSNFFFIALMTLLLGRATDITRNVVVSALVMAWGVRISGFLFTRVMIVGSDKRFEDIRASFFKFSLFWIAQMIWAWGVSLPVIILNSPAVTANPGNVLPAFGTARDIVGIIIWAAGLAIEAVADGHKAIYDQENGPAPVLPLEMEPSSCLLWMICWWGIWTVCISPVTDGTVTSPTRNALLASVVSPILTFLILMLGSGMLTAERPQAERYYLMSHGPNATKEDAGIWPAYEEYLRSTSILIPLPPSIYRPLPRSVKRWVLFDWLIFRLNEADKAVAVYKAQLVRT